MAKYLLYKPLKNLAKILSFGQNIDISLGGFFYAPCNMRKALEIDLVRYQRSGSIFLEPFAK